MLYGLKDVEKLARDFGNDDLEIAKELKRVQSVKCRLKKQKFKGTYEEEMTNVVSYEQLLKEAREYIKPRGKFVTEFEREDVERLDYDEVVKAIRSIQSKKTNSRFLCEDLDENKEYKRALIVEEMLKERKERVKPVEDGKVRKSEVQKVVEVLENNGEVSKEKMLEMLKNLVG